MPSIKPLNRYPGEFRDLFVAAQARSITLRHRTPAEARQFRKQLYNYRVALRRAAKADPALRKLAAQANTLIFRQMGSILIAEVSNYRDTETVQRALDLNPNPEPNPCSAMKL